MRFAEPIWLTVLLLVPLLGFLAWRAAKFERIRRASLGQHDLIRRSGSSGSVVRVGIKLALGTGAIALLILALARPQVGTAWSKVKGAGIDVILCFDVSNSMRAEDAPGSRLGHGLQFSYVVLDGLAGSRVGVVTFSDAATTVCPLTSDLGAVITMLGSVTYESIGQGGTVLADAITEAARRFDPEHKTGPPDHQITDGEDQEETLDAAIEAAKQANIVVYAVGLGTPGGATIPEPGVFGIKTKTYRGETVITRLQEQSLKKLAEATRGTYVRASERGAVERLIAAIAKQPGKRTTEHTAATGREMFQLPLSLALVLLLADMLVGDAALERRGRRGA